MMAIRRVIFVCNAMDDVLRSERNITTDSPAASRKIIQLCLALRRAGVRPMILSLGRGRADGSTAYFVRTVRRVQGVPIVYAPFSRLHGVSELLSLAAPALTVFRLGRRGRSAHSAVVFYNREPAYVPSLIVAALRRFRRVLDLEDGEVGRSAKGLRGLVSRGVQGFYDRLCSTGALLACSALSSLTAARRTMCYYGTAEQSASELRWRGDGVSALLGGTLAPDTGVGLLIDAVQSMRRSQPAWADRLHIHVTGKGPSLDALTSLATDATQPRVTIHGRTTDQEYRHIVERCEIGLALKPVNGPLADTTFPSKVVELASASMLVVTTNISDVRSVLGDGALYIERDDPQELVELLRCAVEERMESRAIAEAGCRAVWARCAPHAAGTSVSEFIFGAVR